MKNLVRFGVVVLILVHALNAAHAAQPQHPQQLNCPDVAIVAARGSEQNTTINPQTYSDTAPTHFASNGFEGENIQGFLHHAERYYAHTHNGASLLENVAILALDDVHYPASFYLPPIADENETVSTLEALRRLAIIVRDYPPHILIPSTIKGFIRSVDTGITSLPGFISDYERSSGCQPDYVFIGYSQGALVLNSFETRLSETGRLKAAFYLGNPLLDQSTIGPRDIIVGHPQRGRGLVSHLAPIMPETIRRLKQGSAATIPHLHYCVRGDFACDSTVESLDVSARSRGGIHGSYFTKEELSGDDTLVIQRLVETISSTPPSS